MHSNYTKLSHSIKGIFNHLDILTLARKVGFTSRLRTLHPANLVAAMIQSLGCMKQANLADVLRTLNAKFQDMDNYKPFHNQLKKQSLTALLKSLTEKASKNLLLEPFKAALPSHYPFKHIHLHDGSSLTLHEKLKDTLPGRFTKTAPAAIELHLTLDLVAGTANYIGLDADKESEKHHRPFADELIETLVLMDAGYFDINYCHEINDFKGFLSH